MVTEKIRVGIIGKHLYCEWPLAATTEQAQQLRDLAGLTHQSEI